MNGKWDDRFMELARHVAQWSKDPSTKCGAVITDDKFIVSVGFNGFAQFTDDSIERYEDRDYKYENVIHDAENAILSAHKDLIGTTIYSSCTVCTRCVARVIQSGIMRVVIPCKAEDPFSYRTDWDKSYEDARVQLEHANVELEVLEWTGFSPYELMGPKHPERIRTGI
jgi:dCMP deaminase